MIELMKDLEDCHLFTSEEDVRQRMGDEFVDLMKAVDDDSKVDVVTANLQEGFMEDEQ